MKIVNGLCQSPKITQRIFPTIEKGPLSTVNALVVHQTGGATKESAFNSYKAGNNGAHFLVDKTGKVYQTAHTNRKTYHVGKIRARCRVEKSCSATELTAVEAILFKEGVSYAQRTRNLHNHEKAKAYPDRYPMNEDSLGIEVVGRFDPNTEAYEALNPLQIASLKWLVAELLSAMGLGLKDVFRHPAVSYKQPSEASTARW